MMYYQEPLRPQIHYSPAKNWINDPNGLVYFDGEYHLFYQRNPFGNDHHHMHWGHAVSEDLFHWKELDIALEPDELGTIFSGSAVVDTNNTSGLFNGPNGGLVAIFTHDGTSQQQSIAYSEDKGRTWTKYEHNPVLPNTDIKDFRDPKVFWHQNTQKWVMLLACGDHIQIYTSPNLIEWSYQSSFGQDYGSYEGVWECPDLFPLSVEDSSEQVWVLIVSMNAGGPNGGSAVQYFTGDFDGVQFYPNESPDDPLKWVDDGKDFYASITWYNTEETYWIGWMNNWQYAGVVPVSPWRSSMSIVRQLSLKKVNDKYVLKQQPVVPSVNVNHKQNNDVTIKEGTNQQLPISLPASVNITINEKSNSKCWGLILISDKNEEFTIHFHLDKDIYTFERRDGSIDFSSDFPGNITGSLKGLATNQVFCLLDYSSIEIFVNGGVSVSTNVMYPKGKINQIRVFSDHKELVLDDIEINEYPSIWSSRESHV
ncbi:glycoside hydrolase family 32 protein [Lentibacillus sp. L22]|uniref:glycoside hydrolase family 32 protein n=1 Tax=Lentibacillus TaxID=175304 RepID=UPI0022B0DF5B|nr:glycoside hydrolase family 32 protein [Lentibacillus daqui]